MHRLLQWPMICDWACRLPCPAKVHQPLAIGLALLQHVSSTLNSLSGLWLFSVHGCSAFTFQRYNGVCLGPAAQRALAATCAGCM